MDLKGLKVKLMLERCVYHIFPIWIQIWGHMFGGSSWGSRTLIIKLTSSLLYACINHPFAIYIITLLKIFLVKGLVLGYIQDIFNCFFLFGLVF